MILEADGIQLNFNDRKVLQDIFISVNRGEIVGVLGRNGSGKSCLFQIIYGMLNAYSASVRFNGKPLERAYKDPELMQYLPQFHFIPESFTIAAVLRHYKHSEQHLIETYPFFENKIKEKVGLLSGGEKRILEVYLILHGPAVFTLLDEPFSFISPKEVETLKAVIQSKKATKGILVSDHLYRHILDVSDRLYLLHNHKLYPVTSEAQLTSLGYLPET